MKTKYTVVLALCCLLAACEKKETSPIQRQTQEIIISALSPDEPSTKTVRQSNGAVFWSPGDQLSIFYGSGSNGGSLFTSLNTEAQQIADFRGTIEVITGGDNIPDEAIHFWGLYPYDANASCDATSITTSVKQTQIAKAGTFSDATFPSLGRSTGLKMPFYNICGGIKFTVTTEGIKKVILKGNNNENIAGRIKVVWDQDNRPLVSEYVEGAKEITLKCKSGETLTPGTAYYFVLPPTVFEKGFTLTFETDTQRAIRELTSKVTIKRAIFGVLENADNGIEYIESSINPPEELIDCKDLPFCFEAIEDCEFSFAHWVNPGNVEYRINDSEWIIDNAEDALTLFLKAGDKAFIRTKQFNLLEYNDSDEKNPYFAISDKKKGYIYGNLMSLVVRDDYSSLTELPSGFDASSLFKDLNVLSHPEYKLELPATKLTNSCYYRMFENCKLLERAPELPATILEERCYGEMFSGCTNLTTAPELPATSLAPSCYQYMFSGCTSLTRAPELPATSLAPSCYHSMFYGCTNLFSATEVLPAVKLESFCYASMFRNCYSLEAAPLLPALSLETSSYSSMFYNCHNLQSISICAEDISAQDGLKDWVTGVSASGLLTKNIFSQWDAYIDANIPSGWTIKTEYPYIDLGLSVYWSPYNIGATSINDVGDYFAWGETSTKQEFKLDTYKFGNYNTGALNKYCLDSSYGIVDNIQELEDIDDPAKNWGIEWETPSKEQFEELKANCTVSILTDNYGHRTGLKVTGPNGNYFTAPTAYVKDDDGIYQQPNSYSATFWSSSVHEIICKYAYAYFIMDDGYWQIQFGGYDRYVGFPIRPVKRK